MATYTTTQDGAWNTDATWGGGGHPDTAADEAVIGHKVTFDRGVDTVAFHDVTVNSIGMLVFPVDSSWKLLFDATGTLIINSGGEIRTGTTSAADYIGTSYLGQIHFPQGSSARYVFVLNDGGIINLWGADIYGTSNRYIYLDSNWTTGDTLYVTGDITAKTCWAAGNKFYIHDNADAYVDYKLQGDIYEIDSIGSYDAGNDRTPVVVTESNPIRSCYAVSTPGIQSKLILISRNLELCDPAATLGVYDYGSYTERIRFDNNQETGNENILIKNCIFSGWESCVYSGYNFYGENLNFISNNYGTYSGTNHQVTGDFVSNYTDIYSGTNHQVTGDFVSNFRGIYSGTNCQVTGDIVSNYNGIYSDTNCQVTGDFVSNFRGIDSDTNSQVTGDIVSNATGIYFGTNCQVTGDFTSNETGIYSGTNHQVTGDFVSNDTGISSGTNYQVTGDFDNTTDVSLTNANKISNVVLENCTLEQSNKQPLRIYQNAGNMLPLVSGDAGFQTPPSGNTWIMQAIPNSYCEMTFVKRISLSPSHEMAYYGAAEEQTLTFKIYPLVYASSLDQDDVQLVVRYLDSESGISRTTVYNTAQTYAIDGWRDCSVTFTPSQAGIVYFHLHIGKYESGATVLIDPVWSVA